jgi:hypothetical protein
MNTNTKIIENNYVNMKRMKAHNGEMVYTFGHGAVTVQINKEKAEFICRMLADWLGFEVEKKEFMRIIKNKANVNSTKEKPLGIEHS